MIKDPSPYKVAPQGPPKLQTPSHLLPQSSTRSHQNVPSHSVRRDPSPDRRFPLR
ncbi:hypothetical protein BJX65DRAFT_278332 [Aspergillus insuetus]